MCLKVSSPSGGHNRAPSLERPSWWHRWGFLVFVIVTLAGIQTLYRFRYGECPGAHGIWFEDGPEPNERPCQHRHHIIGSNVDLEMEERSLFDLDQPGDEDLEHSSALFDEELE